MDASIMKTPLYDAHVALGARMAPFAGWEMPIQYEGILAEHHHTRAAASIFDTCHMGEFDVRGPAATADLERLLTQPVATLQAGQCRYGFLLRDDGGVLDDLTCYRRGPDHFFLVVNAGTLSSDADWIRAHLSPSTRFTDLSPGRAKLDIQGPTARAEMEKALGVRLPELKYFFFTDGELAGVPGTLSRTGYTGEWGYEFYFPAEAARMLWDRFLAGGGIRPAGLGARDTLRLEMGYPLYGHELGPDRTPVGACRGPFIDTGKDFIGKAAVLRDQQNGAARIMVGLRLDGKQAARAHDRVLEDGRVVGEVTSGAFAPSVGVAVALAYVDRTFSEVGRPLAIDVRGRPRPATVVDLPFYKNGTARKKSAAGPAA
jgi:aminomethyltransferase